MKNYFILFCFCLSLGLSLSAQEEPNKNKPLIKVEISTPRLQVGMVEVRVNLEAQRENSALEKAPQIYWEIDKEQYSFLVTTVSPGFYQGNLLITEEHPEGEGKIYLLFPASSEAQFLGDLEVDSPGGNSPFLYPKKEYQIYKTSKTNQTSQSKDKNPSSLLFLKSDFNEKIVALEDGRIVEIFLSSKGQAGYIRIQRLRDGFTWGYHNILPIVDSNHQKNWALGDVVNEGDILGTVAFSKDFSPYLGLELFEEEESGIKEHPPINYLAKGKYKEETISILPRTIPMMLSEEISSPKKISFGLADIVFLVYVGFFLTIIKLVLSTLR